MNHFKIWSNFKHSNSPALKIKTWRLRWRSCAAKYHPKSSATTTAWLPTEKGTGCRSRPGLHGLSHAGAPRRGDDAQARAGHPALRKLRPLSLFAGSNEGRRPETNRQAGAGQKAAKVKSFFAVGLSVEPDGHPAINGCGRASRSHRRRRNKCSLCCRVDQQEIQFKSALDRN